MAIIPYLYYEDVAAALKFLRRAFGFVTYGPQMKNADGTINHAAMKFGKDVVMMGDPGPSYRNPKHLSARTQSVLVNVKNVDKHFDQARKAGAVIIDPPKDTPFGQRRYGAEDPEGHQWYFAQQIRRRRTKRG